MTGRISIPALRQVLAQPSIHEAYAHPEDILALMEAVEAQRAYVLANVRDPGNRDEGEIGAASRRMVAALARFDFGEDTDA